MTAIDALKSLTTYPIPPRTLTRIAVVRGISPTAEATKALMESSDFKLAEVDVLKFLVAAPSVNEGGVSFNFSQTERDEFKKEIAAIQASLGQTKPSVFGYKGESL